MRQYSFATFNDVLHRSSWRGTHAVRSTTGQSPTSARAIFLSDGLTSGCLGKNVSRLLFVSTTFSRVCPVLHFQALDGECLFPMAARSALKLNFSFSRMYVMFCWDILLQYSVPSVLSVLSRSHSKLCQRIDYGWRVGSGEHFPVIAVLCLKPDATQ